MTNPSLAGLIEELEGAPEGSRELDAKVFWFHFPEYDRATTPLQACLHYTTSLDAALTLLPEGYNYQLLKDPGSHRLKTYRVQVKTPEFREGEIWSGAHRTSPALALVIACLRARESEG